MNIPHFTYHTPASLNECLDLLQNFGQDAELLAGGTDLLVRMKMRLCGPKHLVSLSRLSELNSIRLDKSQALLIGATVTLSDLTQSPVVRERCPVLAQAAETVATKQIRNFATLAGNVLQNTRCLYYNRSMAWGKGVEACIKRGGSICHAVPKGSQCFAVYQGDMAPVLIALGASARIELGASTQEVPVESIFSGKGKTPLKNLPGKLVSHFKIPVSSSNQTSMYRKYRVRDGIDFPLAGVAIAARKHGASVSDIRVCLTGVSSSPLLVEKAAQFARGKTIDEHTSGEVAEIVYQAAHPLANLDGDPYGRRSMTRFMVKEILADLLTRT